MRFMGATPASPARAQAQVTGRSQALLSGKGLLPERRPGAVSLLWTLMPAGRITGPVF